jgi:hypothetical protein
MLDTPILLIAGWAALVASVFLTGLRRARKFEAVLARAGFTAVHEAATPSNVFRRSDTSVSRVVKGQIGNRPALFVFGRCRGRPIFFEGILDVPRMPVTAVILRVEQPRAWIETWTSERAYRLGWRPAQTAETMTDGRIALIWEGSGESRHAFETCCAALSRTPAL